MFVLACHHYCSIMNQFLMRISITLFYWIVLKEASCPVSACFMRFVPDLNENDRIPYPWDEEGNKEKYAWDKLGEDACKCGEIPEDAKLPGSWDTLVEFANEGDTSPQLTKGCGGTLVNSLYVMTSMSCLLHKATPLADQAKNMFSPAMLFKRSMLKDGLVLDSVPGLKVHFNFQQGENKTVKSLAKDVVNIIVHPQYATDSIMKYQHSADIALLKLNSTIDFASDVKPICLYSGPRATAGEGRYFMDSNNGKDCNSLLAGNPEQNMFLQNCFSKQAENFANLSSCRPKKVLPTSNLMCTFDVFPQSHGWPVTGTLTTKQIAQIGIASWKDVEVIKTRFFTNVTGMLPYINRFAKPGEWCRTHKLKGKNHPNLVKDDERRPQPGEHFPWNDYVSTRKLLKDYDNCVCGVRNGPQGRIVGGKTAAKHEFKWQVLLKISGRFNSKDKVVTSTCGGSLINDRMILTAAHCVVQHPLLSSGQDPVVDPKDVKAYLGAVTRNGDDSTSVPIDRVHIHPDFLPGYKIDEFDWDVALLETAAPVKFDKEKIMPVCLPTAEEAKSEKLDPVGHTAWVIGWGKTAPNGNGADRLQKIELPVATLKDCNDLMLRICEENRRPSSRCFVASERYICIGTLNRWKDAAAGDSGGPATMVIQKNQHVEIGIVSFGSDSQQNNKDTAALYTDVRKVLSFIDYYSDKARGAWCPMVRTNGGRNDEMTETIKAKNETNEEGEGMVIV